MFISNRLIFLQLQKTGCTHITSMLASVEDGQVISKHARMPDRFEPGERFVLGSIRNPWDWYVSLWAFGCDGKGLLRTRATQKLRGIGVGEQGLRALPCVLKALAKPSATWRRVYADPGDPALFRQWLAMIMDPRRACDLGEGFAYSPIHRFAGLLTYRYLRLFATEVAPLYKKRLLRDVEDLKAFDAEKNLLGFVIRNERLTADLLDALDAASVPVTAEQRARILRAERSNVSSRTRDLRFYYDEASVELVRSHDRLIIDQFGYSFD